MKFILGDIMENLRIQQSVLFLIAICLLCFFIAHSYYYFHLLSLNAVIGYQMISLWIYAITDVLIAFFIVLFMVYLIYKIIKHKDTKVLSLVIYCCVICLFLILIQIFANNLNTLLNLDSNDNFVIQLLYIIFLGLFIGTLFISFIVYHIKKNNISATIKKITYSILYFLLVINCVLFTILTFSNIQIYQNEIWDVINQIQPQEEMQNLLLNSLQLNITVYKLQISIGIIIAITLTIAYIISLLKLANINLKHKIINLCFVLSGILVLIYYLIFAILFLIFDGGFVAVFTTQIIVISMALLLIIIYIFYKSKNHLTRPVKAE